MEPVQVFAAVEGVAVSRRYVRCNVAGRLDEGGAQQGPFRADFVDVWHVDHDLGRGRRRLVESYVFIFLIDVFQAVELLVVVGLAITVQLQAMDFVLILTSCDPAA